MVMKNDQTVKIMQEYWKAVGELKLQQERMVKLLTPKGKVCPFCKEDIENLPNHINKIHKKEIKVILKGIDKEKFLKIRKELIAESLEK